MKKIAQIIIFFVIISCNSQSNNLIPFEGNNGWGYKDKNGKIIIKEQFGIVSEFTTCGIAQVGTPNNGNYYIDKTGKKLDIPIYKTGNFIDDFSDGYARFKKNNKMGFINECGEITIKAQFEFVSPFYNGIAIVRKGFILVGEGPYKSFEGGSFGAIDKKGNLVINYNKFDFIYDFQTKDSTNAKIGNKFYSIDSKGNVINKL